LSRHRSLQYLAGLPVRLRSRRAPQVRHVRFKNGALRLGSSFGTRVIVKTELLARPSQWNAMPGFSLPVPPLRGVDDGVLNRFRPHCQRQPV
jgi:hypothetical protein